MDFFNTARILFECSIILYIIAALAALVFLKRHKISNVLSNTLCMLGAASGLISSTLFLLSSKKFMAMGLPESAIPFVDLVMKIDKLSALFLLMLSILVFCVSLYSLGYVSHYYGKRNVGLFNILYAVFVLSMVFVITAGNAIFFLIAWEVMAVISYLLVVFESEEKETQKAGLLYVVMTHIGTAFLIIACMMMYSYTGSFDLFGSPAGIPVSARNTMFVLFLVGFGTKAGIIPFHIWLPHAHPAAPGNISALMSGIMIKTAVYGLLRFVMLYLGIETVWWGIAVLILGLSSAFLGVAYAFVEQNIKRMLAFSSIENMGIIFIGLGIGFIAFARDASMIGALALSAALLHAFNHTLFKGSLFLGAGSIHYATHTKNMEELGGLIKKMPVTAVLFLGGALSISAIVPFNGFIGEWLTYQAIFAGIIPGQAGYNILFILAVAVLAIAGALAAACFIKLYGISFLGLPRSQHAEKAEEVPLTMSIGTGILTALCLITGVFPLIALSMVEKAVVEMTGQPIMEQLQGGLMIVSYPLQINDSPIMPQWILLALGAFALLIAVAARLIGGPYTERKYGTWDCGYEGLNARMQYSGTAFSKPLRVVFRMIFKSSRDFTVKGDHQYHPETMEFTLKTDSVFEQYIYGPILHWATAFSKKTKYKIQTGSVHTYLLYIFIAVLLLMLYNRIA